MNNIICIAGPTASGKTALAATLAKELNGEVVSCDSMQVYRRMDIGTAKPTLEEMQGIPGLTLYGTDDLQQRVPTAALNIGSCDSGYVSDWLYENYGIAVRSGAHCAPLMHEAFGTREQGAVRFSFSHVLTEEEVRIAAQALREFAEEEMQQ